MGLHVSIFIKCQKQLFIFENFQIMKYLDTDSIRYKDCNLCKSINKNFYKVNINNDIYKSLNTTSTTNLLKKYFNNERQILINQTNPDFYYLVCVLFKRNIYIIQDDVSGDLIYTQL